MSKTGEYQAVELSEAAKRMSTEQLFDLLQGKDVPGMDPDDPTVQLLRAGLPTKPARTAFAMARREGFLQMELGYNLYPDATVVYQVAAVWGIWCAIKEHPPIVLMVMPDGEGRLTCDLGALGTTWTFAGFAGIGRALERKRPRPGYTWSFTETAFAVAGLEAGDAVAMARSVVQVATGGTFRVVEPVYFPESA